MCFACLGNCTMRSSSEFPLLQHGCWHWLPRCCHQLSASWPIFENVAWSTYEIAARSMLIKTIRSFKMFSTGLTHGADGAPYSFRCRYICHDDKVGNPRSNRLHFILFAYQNAMNTTSKKFHTKNNLNGDAIHSCWGPGNRWLQTTKWFSLMYSIDFWYMVGRCEYQLLHWAMSVLAELIIMIASCFVVFLCWFVNQILIYGVSFCAKRRNESSIACQDAVPCIKPMQCLASKRLMQCLIWELGPLR